MVPLHKYALCVTGALWIAACSKSPQPAQTTVEGQTSTSPSAAQARKELNTLVRFINATQTSKDLYYRGRRRSGYGSIHQCPVRNRDTLRRATEWPTGRPP
jgi:hypothetical protein